MEEVHSIQFTRFITVAVYHQQVAQREQQQIQKQSRLSYAIEQLHNENQMDNLLKIASTGDLRT